MSKTIPENARVRDLLPTLNFGKSASGPSVRRLTDGGLDQVTPLYECDSARINVESGHLMVEDAISTDMVYLLGLRNGDRLVEVNSMSIDDPILAAVAYTTLWQDQAETEYTLKVLRNNSYVYIDY